MGGNTSQQDVAMLVSVYGQEADLDASEFLEAIRNHWQVENGLHWVKDGTLKEDYPPRRGGSAPINWAVFNSFLIT